MSAVVQERSTAKTNLYISKKEEEDGVLYFTLSATDVSIANGLRRTILSDIPTLVFKTFPDKQNQAKISEKRIQNQANLHAG